MADTYSYFVAAYSIVTVIYAAYAISLWRRAKREAAMERRDQ